MITFHLTLSHQADDTSKPLNWEAYAIVSEQEVAQVMAALPKAIKVRQTTLSRPVDGVSYTSGTEVVPYLDARGKMFANGVNGGVNEAGVKRFARLVKACRELGYELVWTTPYTNSYATLADAELALGLR